MKLCKILIPFTPHLANECLEEMNEKKVDEWPTIDKKFSRKLKSRSQFKLMVKQGELPRLAKISVKNNL